MKETKQQLVEKAMDTILNPGNDYGSLIKDAVEYYLKTWTKASLMDLLYEGIE